MAPVTRPGSFLALLCLLRWRRPEARLVAALACVPQTPMLYEAVPLFLVPRTVFEAATLVVLSFAAMTLTAVSRQGGFGIAPGNWDIALFLLYAPCTAMVIRRPNVGSLPSWIESRLPRVWAGLASRQRTSMNFGRWVRSREPKSAIPAPPVPRLRLRVGLCVLAAAMLSGFGAFLSGRWRSEVARLRPGVVCGESTLRGTQPLSRGRAWTAFRLERAALLSADSCHRRESARADRATPGGGALRCWRSGLFVWAATRRSLAPAVVITSASAALAAEAVQWSPLPGCCIWHPVVGGCSQREADNRARDLRSATVAGRRCRDVCSSSKSRSYCCQPGRATGSRRSVIHHSRRPGYALLFSHHDSGWRAVGARAASLAATGGSTPSRAGVRAANDAPIRDRAALPDPRHDRRGRSALARQLAHGAVGMGARALFQRCCALRSFCAGQLESPCTCLV